MDRGLKCKGFTVIGALLCAMAMQAHAATITVTNTNDSGPGSLRQALANANNGDRINFAVTGTIALTNGGLEVNKNVMISGPGANQLSIDGNHATLVFGVAPQRTVSISGLSITNGQYGISNIQGTVSVTNCVLSGNSITGLYNYAGQGSVGASMTVANSIISNNADGIQNVGFALDYGATANLTVVNSNVSDNDGGGISNEGTEGNATATIFSTAVSGNSAGGVFTSGSGHGFQSLAITNSTVSGNSTYGGIRASGDSYLSVANSTISGNSAANSGGGIYAGGFDASIANSTISGNSAGTSGGAIYCQGLAQDVSIRNSTISGNSAGTSGGGIYNVSSNLQVATSTISGNSAGSGGGIYIDGPYGRIQITSTIIDAGASGENIFNLGAVTSHGYNLSSDDGGGYLNGPGDQINTDPLLGPLEDNGGPTETHALLLGSPAIDQGNSGGVYIDQRRFHRPFDVPGIPNAVGGDGSDIGAFEFGAFAIGGDFNGDGFTDYLLFNSSSRATAIWYLQDNIYVTWNGRYGPTLPIGWTAVDAADFNGDSKPDYVLYNASTRQTAIWYLNNNVLISAAYGPTIASGYVLSGVADFNGDGKPDYVLYNASTRQTAIWYLNNNVLVSGAYGPTIASGYVLSGVADFNSDGKPDYVLYNANTRQTAIWYLDNNVFVSGAYGPTIASGYVLSGVADFNTDGKPDYVLYSPGTRQTLIWYLDNNIYLCGAWGPTLPAGWSLVAP